MSTRSEEIDEKADLFEATLCAPERGPVIWERKSTKRGMTWVRGGLYIMVARRAYRLGLVDGLRGRRSKETSAPDLLAAAYTLGWQRGSFPRPYRKEVHNA